MPAFPYICDKVVNTYQGTLENTERGTLVKKLFFTGGRYMNFMVDKVIVNMFKL